MPVKFPPLGPVDLTRCCHVRFPEGRCAEKAWGAYSFCVVHAKVGIAEGWLEKKPTEVLP